MRSVIIGITDKGETTLLKGVSTAPDAQRKEIAGYRHKGLPRGLAEIHQLPLSGSIKKAVAKGAPPAEGSADDKPAKPKTRAKAKTEPKGRKAKAAKPTAPEPPADKTGADALA